MIVLPDALTTITKLIQSPPGQLAAGGVLAGIVWKFFERVEAVLTDQTKLEIAVWLLGVKVAQRVEPWPDTFARVFDRVFGTKHLSWKCFRRSCVASSIVTVVGSLSFLFLYRHQEPTLPTTFGGISVDWGFRWWMNEVLLFTPIAVVANAFPDYLSLIKTRYLLKCIQVNLWSGAVSIGVDLLVTCVLSLSSALILGLFYPFTQDYTLAFLHFISLIEHSEAATPIVLPALPLNHLLLSARVLLTQQWGIVFFYPAFVTTMWTVLYAGSGFILKAARRFDIGFQWFNRKFDIEKKPLQSIGLVAGALVAVVYWAAVIVSRVVG